MADRCPDCRCDCRPGMDGGGVYHDLDCPAYLRGSCKTCNGTAYLPAVALSEEDRRDG